MYETTDGEQKKAPKPTVKPTDVSASEDLASGLKIYIRAETKTSIDLEWKSIKNARSYTVQLFDDGQWIRIANPKDNKCSIPKQTWEGIKEIRVLANLDGKLYDLYDTVYCDFSHDKADGERKKTQKPTADLSSEELSSGLKIYIKGETDTSIDLEWDLIKKAKSYTIQILNGNRWITVASPKENKCSLPKHTWKGKKEIRVLANIDGELCDFFDTVYCEFSHEITEFKQKDKNSISTEPTFLGPTKRTTPKPTVRTFIESEERKTPKPTIRPKAKVKPTNTLKIVDYKASDRGLYFDDRAEWNFSGDTLNIRFRMKAGSKNVVAFELYLYATNVWGEKIYGKDKVYHVTTERNIKANKTAYSDYFSLPKRKLIDRVYCGIKRVKFSDGSKKEYELSENDYYNWSIK